MDVRIENTENFYETALLWWSKHKILVNGEYISYPPIHKSFLPEEVFIVSADNKDLYSCFFYHTNSSLAWIAYPISNLESSKQEREGALQYLFNEMEIYAIKKGYYLMFTTSPIPNVINTLKKCDYIEGDMSVNQYFKQLF